MVITVKDCFNFANEVTHLGLDNEVLKYKSLRDSKVVQLLRGNELTNSTCTPFCVGVLDERLIHTNNLYAGASSSGGAICIDHDLAEVAITTCTGGSTIVPAARCDIWGFKPTYGRISRRGLVPLCSALDTVSLMSKDIVKLRSVFSILDLNDSEDSTSLPQEGRWKLELLDLRIAHNLFNKQDLALVRSMFPNVIEGDLNLNCDALLGAYFYILTPDFYSNMARFDGINHKYKDKTMVLDYNIDKVKDNRSKELSTEIQSRLLCGAHYLMNYDFLLIDKVKTHYEKLMGPYTWILPIAEDLRTNQLKATPYCVLNNILKRPTIALPSKVSQGVQISAPFNKDLSLLQFVEDNFNDTF